MPETGYSNDDESILPHVLYMFSHANVWHMLGNLFILWILRRPLFMPAAFLIGFFASYLPVLPGLWDLTNQDSMVTMGMSGMLFAIIGIKWGNYYRLAQSLGEAAEKKAFKDFCVKVLPFVIGGALLPHVNWSIHLYCLLAGTLYGKLIGFEIKKG